jgi:glycosyltransferase involved in cell wall biosynthesis
MRVSIGMLAYNEEGRIGRALRAVLDQTLLRSPRSDIESIEIVCVPNGCKDRTASEARAELERACGSGGAGRVTWKVSEIERADKCNAWNHFVHSASDQSAEFLFLLDADIWFEQPECLERVLAKLVESPVANLCVDTPLKHNARSGGKGPLERASVSLSEVRQAGPLTVAGSLYCARSAFIRRLWLPVGLLGDDGFVRAMLLTDFFSVPERMDRIVRAEGAAHFFEACSGIGPVFRHSKRLAVGTAMNCILFEHLWAHRNGEDGGSYFKRRTDKEPGWVRRTILEEVQRRGFWAVGTGEALRHFGNLKGLSLARRLRLLPVCIAGTLFDFAVLFAANRALKKGDIRW